MRKVISSRVFLRSGGTNVLPDHKYPMVVENPGLVVVGECHVGVGFLEDVECEHVE